MAIVTKANSTKITSKAKALTTGRTTKSTQANGKLTKCMARGCSNGRTARFMKESLPMIKEKDKANSHGKMGRRLQANGRMASNMVKAHLLINITKQKKELGKKVRMYIGKIMTQYEDTLINIKSIELN